MVLRRCPVAQQPSSITAAEFHCAIHDAAEECLSWPAQVLAGSSEQLTMAREEISIMKRLRHPNLLPLLGSALVSVDTASGARAQARLQAQILSCCCRPHINTCLSCPFYVGAADRAARCCIEICRSVQAAYLLFPLYSGGSLAELGEWLAAERRLLPTIEVLHLFLQVGSASAASWHRMQLRRSAIRSPRTKLKVLSTMHVTRAPAIKLV